MLLRSPRKAVPCPAFVKEQDPRVTAVPKKSGGGKVGKRGYSARRFLLFVRDIFPGRGSPTPARGPTCEIQGNLRSPPARYTRRRKTLPALTYKRRLQALIWACMPYFKASERHLEPRTSSGRAWPVASKPWHTPDRQQLVRARSSGKAARQSGQKDCHKDPSRALDKMQRSHRPVGWKSIRNPRPTLYGLKIQYPLTRPLPSLHRSIAEPARSVKEHQGFGRTRRIHELLNIPYPCT